MCLLVLWWQSEFLQRRSNINAIGNYNFAYSLPDEIVAISKESEGGYDHISIPIGCKIEINDVSRSEEVGIFPIRGKLA